MYGANVAKNWGDFSVLASVQPVDVPHDNPLRQDYSNFVNILKTASDPSHRSGDGFGAVGASIAIIEIQAGARINSAVQNFTQVTRHFAGISDEVAQNSEILAHRAEELSEAISYFKTE